MASRLIAFASAALLASLVPLRANAGGVLITAHELNITLKLTDQGTTSGGENKITRSTENQKDVFSVCTGSPPTKTQGVFLFMQCGAFSALNTNEIDAIDTNPLTGLQKVGSLSFDTTHLVDMTKSGGVVKQVSVPVVLTLNCGENLSGIAWGTMDLKYSDLSTVSCPESATMKITGSGGSANQALPPLFIIDDTSSLKAKNRDGAIQTLPPFP